MKITQFNKNNKITKSNQLITARYKLTIFEQKLIFIMISMIHPDDKDFNTYKIKISELQKFLGIKNQQIYTNLKIITKKLRKKDVEIDTPNGVLQIGWLSSAEYFEKKGYVELCFDPKLKPYLLQLKRCFTSYFLNEVIQFKSFHSIRIFELIKQHEDIGHRSFDLAELKKILGLESGKYHKFKDFKRRVLSPAQEEIQKKTKITYDFKAIKTGREITGVHFYNIKMNINENLKNQEEDEKLREILDRHGIELSEQKQIEKIYNNALEKKNPEYAISNLTYALSKSKNNLSGYFADALKHDWGREIRELEGKEKRKKEAKNNLQDMIKQIKTKLKNLKNPSYKGYKITHAEEEMGILFKIDKNSYFTTWDDITLNDIVELPE